MKTQATDGQASLEQEKEEQAFLEKWEEDYQALLNESEERIAREAKDKEQKMSLSADFLRLFVQHYGRSPLPEQEERMRKEKSVCVRVCVCDEEQQ
jgi:hypothetical protein